MKPYWARFLDGAENVKLFDKPGIEYNMGPRAEIHRRISRREFLPEAGELRPGHGGTPGADGPGLGASERADPGQAPGSGNAPQPDPEDLRGGPAVCLTDSGSIGACGQLTGVV